MPYYFDLQRSSRGWGWEVLHLLVLSSSQLMSSYGNMIFHALEETLKLSPLFSEKVWLNQDNILYCVSLLLFFFFSHTCFHKFDFFTFLLFHLSKIFWILKRISHFQLYNHVVQFHKSSIILKYRWFLIFLHHFTIFFYNFH